jgi:hypothetical protein
MNMICNTALFFSHFNFYRNVHRNKNYIEKYRTTYIYYNQNKYTLYFLPCPHYIKSQSKSFYNWWSFRQFVLVSGPIKGSRLGFSLGVDNYGFSCLASSLTRRCVCPLSAVTVSYTVYYDCKWHYLQYIHNFCQSRNWTADYGLIWAAHTTPAV